MVKLEAFSGLTKKQEDLLRVNYCFGSLAILTLNTTHEDLTFNFRTSKKSSDNVLASAWLQYKTNQLTFKGKKRNDAFSNYSAEWMPKNYVENVKLKTECKLTSPAGARKMESTTSAEYNIETFKGKLAFSYNPMQVKATATMGKPEYGLGLDGKYDIDTQRLHGYNIATWWSQKYRKVVLKHEGVNKEEYALGNLLVSYYQRLNDKAHVGALVKSNWSSKETSLEVGGDYQYDPSTNLKGKIGSTGLVGLAVNRKLNDYWTLGAAVQVDVNSVTSNSINDYKLGFKLDFKY